MYTSVTPNTDTFGSESDNVEKIRGVKTVLKDLRPALMQHVYKTELYDS